jgi:hypothetical protein
MGRVFRDLRGAHFPFLPYWLPDSHSDLLVKIIPALGYLLDSSHL